MTTKAWRSGPWRLLGARELFDTARPALEQAAREARIEHETRALGPFTAVFKGSPFPPRASLRHAVRSLAGLSFPRLAEFSNLAWLREHGFLAPRPLLAGVLRSAGLPRYQCLFTERVPDAHNLAEAFPGAESARRQAWLTALARDLARLHGLGFVHRDLFPRNLLVTDEGEARCHFLDAWRGGPGPGLRGPEFDLGCLFLDGASLFLPREQFLFLTTYREERARSGQALDSGWPRRVEKARSTVFRREQRRRAGLAPSWTIPIPDP